MPSFPRIGKLGKGGERQGNRPGRELEHWRFTSAQAEVEAAFEAAYGEKPYVVNVFLPYGKLEENWLTWKEKWAAGGLVHRCDGQTMHLWRDERGKYRQEPKPCPYADNPNDKDACKEVGRLIVVVPELWEAGHVGFVTMETHSLNDVLNIHASLLRMLEESPAGLRGVPFLLRRVPAMISTPGEGSKRVRREKWLVALEPAARWSRLQLKAAEAAAMRNERALPAPEPGVTIDAVTGEVINDDVPWDDAPGGEVDASGTEADASGAEVDADFDWVNDPAKKKAFAAEIKALGVKDPSWITAALGVM
ncbi:MAG: hypothetical protein GX537_01680 [Actinobacteria bacterium]|nr:hypothetical protein [Actinomycetota bacterium]